MKYLLLAYHEEKKWGALSKSKQDAIMSECCPYDEALPEERSLDRHGGPPADSDGHDHAGPERHGPHHRRSLRRDEGAAGRVLPHQRQGPERGHPGGLEHCGSAPGRAFGMGRRGAADRSVRAAVAAGAPLMMAVSQVSGRAVMCRCTTISPSWLRMPTYTVPACRSMPPYDWCGVV
jgi:hypothetical protein